MQILLRSDKIKYQGLDITLNEVFMLFDVKLTSDSNNFIARLDFQYWKSKQDWLAGKGALLLEPVAYTVTIPQRNSEGEVVDTEVVMTTRLTNSASVILTSEDLAKPVLQLAIEKLTAHFTQLGIQVILDLEEDAATI